MFVSVGSRSNVAERSIEAEERRADILEYNPDGSGLRIYATGIRNAVGIAVHPKTGELWASVNERDGLGDDLVPDYVTRVKERGFYGWPWFYMGPHQDPRHPDAHPELRDKVLTPDVLIQSHSASLEMVFYAGRQFPSEYAETRSPRSTAPGTAPTAPVTRSFAFRSKTERRRESTRTS